MPKEQNSFEEELTELGYDDLIPAFQAAVRQGAQAMLGAQRQQASRDGWFSDFYKANPSLVGHEDTVNFVMGRDMAELQDLPASQAIDVIAGKARKRLEAQHHHEEYMKPHRAFSGGPDGSLQTLSVDDFERKGITRPGSLSDTIRQRRQQRLERGPTNMARYARESKTQGA